MSQSLQLSSQERISSYHQQQTKPRSRTSWWLFSRRSGGTCSFLYRALTDALKTSCLCFSAARKRSVRKNEATLEIRNHRYPQTHLNRLTLCEPHRCLTATWAGKIHNVHVDLRFYFFVYVYSWYWFCLCLFLVLATESINLSACVCGWMWTISDNSKKYTIHCALLKVFEIYFVNKLECIQ